VISTAFKGSESNFVKI